MIEKTLVHLKVGDHEKHRMAWTGIGGWLEVEEVVMRMLTEIQMDMEHGDRINKT